MSDSGEEKMYMQDSSDSEEGEPSQNSKKRALDVANEEPQSSKLAKKTEEQDAVPHLVCPICKGPFSDPIVTKCKHFFCHKCALKHEMENSTCFVCNQLTLGFFNTAVEIKEKIAQVQQKAKGMVKEVKTMVENAAVIQKEAEAMAAKSAKMVESIETIMTTFDVIGLHDPDRSYLVEDEDWDEIKGYVEFIEERAAKARGMAEKAAEMMKEANATTETARDQMVKALEVMKNVKWNV